MRSDATGRVCDSCSSVARSYQSIAYLSSLILTADLQRPLTLPPNLSYRRWLSVWWRVGGYCTYSASHKKTPIFAIQNNLGTFEHLVPARSCGTLRFRVHRQEIPLRNIVMFETYVIYVINSALRHIYTSRTHNLLLPHTPPHPICDAVVSSLAHTESFG